MAFIHVDASERSLLERVIFGLLLLAVLVLGFFFLVAALIAGAILACVILVRFWWLKRRLARAAEEEFITTEYTVVERERVGRTPIPHPFPFSREEKGKLEPPLSPRERGGGEG